MKELIMVILFSSLLLLACEKHERESEYPFEAEVLGQNHDCGIYAIKILKGIPEVKVIVETIAIDSIYIAKNLPSELQTAGLIIKLDIRRVQDEELGPCTSLGIGYPWLFVENAINKISF